MDAEQTWTCLICGLTLGVDEWECCPGVNHVVPERTFLLADAPQPAGREVVGASGSTPTVIGSEFGGRRIPLYGETHITNVPPPSWELGDQHNGGTVVFKRGRFSTSDPEQQYWLDLHGNFCDEAAWRHAWPLPEELHEASMEAERHDQTTKLAEIAALTEELKRLRAEL